MWLALLITLPFTLLGLAAAIAIARIEWQQYQDRKQHSRWLARTDKGETK